MTITDRSPHLCMYCGHQGPKEDFDDEHVVSRSLVGRGTNWTLRECVCKPCNNRFSKFENELLQQAAESIARGFSGPLGRGAKGKVGSVRQQPMRINHLYAFNKGDPLVYEGGFSFPAEFYFRPQIIDCGNGQGLLSLVTDVGDIAAFQDATTAFIVSDHRITLPREGELYPIIRFGKENNSWRIIGTDMESAPSTVFFREFPDNHLRSRMTARMAQNDDGKLFFRAAAPDAIGSFLDDMFANRWAPLPPQRSTPRPPGDQTFVFSFRPDSEKVLKAVLKTGLNLLAHFFGPSVIQETSFDQVRRILLNERSVPPFASGLCGLWAGETPEFPRHGSSDQHRFMLDIDGGRLRFRMRLYNSFGYAGVLAELDSSLADHLARSLPRRAVADFMGAGIRETFPW